MVTKKLFMVLILLTFLFPINLVSAQQDDIRFYHQINTNLSIFEKCRVEGAICGTDFFCNITVLSPNQILIVDNQLMTRGDIYYNYSLNTTQSPMNGPYETTVDCNNVTSAGTNTFFYEVTPNGSQPMETSQGIIVFIAIILISLISLLCVYLSIKINNGWASLAFISFAVILMVFSFGMILNVLELSFGTFGTIIGNYSALYVTFIALIGVGVISLIIYLIVFALNEYWKSRGLIDEVGFD